MATERDTVLHSWCVQADWNAPTIVGGRGARFWDAPGRTLPRHEQPGRVHEPRPPAPGRRPGDPRAGRARSASSPPRGAPSPAPRWPQLLLEKSGFEGGRVFFTLGGADANEHAVKFARQAAGEPHGSVIARDRSYHGASYGAMALQRRQPHARAGGSGRLPRPPRPAALRLSLPVRLRPRPTSARDARRGRRSPAAIDAHPRHGGRPDGAGRRHQRHRRAGHLLAGAAARDRASAASASSPTR